MVRDTGTRSARRRARGSRLRPARAGAVPALSAALALGAVVAGGLLGGGPAIAAAPTSGWTAAATTAPTGPDTPGANLRLLRLGRLLRRSRVLLGDVVGSSPAGSGDRRDVDDTRGPGSLQCRLAPGVASELRFVCRGRSVCRGRFLRGPRRSATRCHRDPVRWALDAPGRTGPGGRGQRRGLRLTPAVGGLPDDARVRGGR